MKNTYILFIIFLMTTRLSFAQDIGSPAPDFTLNDLDDRAFNLSEQKGKVIAFFMFGYGCSGCIANAPDVQTKIDNQYRSFGDFLMIGMDVWNGTKKEIEGFISTTNIEFETLQLGSDVAQTWGTTYDRLVIIDREGNIAFKGNGVVSNHIDDAIDVLDELLLDYQTSVNSITNNNNKLSIYPNPVAGKANITLNVNNSQNIEFVIYDISGKPVYSEKKWVNKGVNSINLNSSILNEGIHLLKVNTNNSSFTKRFIVR